MCGTETLICAVVLSVALICTYVLAVDFYPNVCKNDPAQIQVSNKKLTIASFIVFTLYFLSIHGFEATGIFFCVLCQLLFIFNWYLNKKITDLKYSVLFCFAFLQ